MQFLCRINDFDITPFIKEDGVNISYEERLQRQITTADGKLHKRQIRKTHVKLEFRDMEDGYYSLITGYLSPNPCQFYYTDYINTTINKTFYITDNGYSVKKVVAGVYSHITGFSLELIEE